MDTVTYEYTLEGDLIRILVDGAIESPAHAMLPEYQVFTYSIPKQSGVSLKERGRVIWHEGGA